MHGAEAREREVGQLRDLLAARHVHAQAAHGGALPLQFGDDGLQRVVLHVGQDELHAARVREPRELAAEAARRAGDDRDLACEVLHRRALRPA